MEDFQAARQAENTQLSGLQTEWMESRTTNIASTTDSSLSLAFAVTDKQAPVTEKPESAEKAQADRLDQELKDFANSKFDNPSRDMLKFQNAVGKFCDATDKEAAMDELGDTWSKINSLVNLKYEAIYYEKKEVIANTPGRKELEAAKKTTEDQFWRKVNDLPFQESWRIQDLMRREEGETKAEHQVRIRKGLANNKPILDSYNAIGVAEEKIEQNKTPREKQLETLGSQLKTDSKIMIEQTEKAYIRSTLKN